MPGDIIATSKRLKIIKRVPALLKNKMINLEDLKKDFKPLKIEGQTIKNWEELKKFWSGYTGYNLGEYLKNEPFLKTQEELEDEYLESAEIPERLEMYLDIEAMIRDDKMSGYLGSLEINNEIYYYRYY